MKKLIVLLMGVIFLSGCKERPYHTLQNYKTPMLELRQLCNKETAESSSNSSGSFFLVAGSYTSSSKETKKITVSVFAMVDSSYRFIEIPIEKIRIRINNDIQKPYLQIQYSAIHVVPTSKLVEGYLNDFEYIVTCPEAYLPEKLLPIDITK